MVNGLDFSGVITPYKLRADEYMKDGIAYCNKCNTPRSFALTFLGVQTTVPIACDCMKKQEEEAKEAALMQKKQGLAMRCKEGIIGKSYLNMRFAGSDSELKWARAYCDGFKEKYLKKSLGLIVVGQKGTGKTFAAACIANQLAEQGHRVTMANIGWFVNQLSSFNTQEVLDSFNKSDLLIIDDFGAERLSDYVCEKLYSLIDSRYVSTLPMIITSNLSMQELKDNKVLKTERMFDRIKQMCHPIVMAGESRRTDLANSRYSRVCKELGM